MLVRYKWSTLFASLFILSSVACAEALPYLDRADQADPEKVMQYLKTVPKKQKKMAESGYEHALKQAAKVKQGSSWGAVTKSCLESISAYPMGKTFLLGIEAELKHWAEVQKRKPVAKRDKAEDILLEMAGRFDAAIAVESQERSLNDAQHQQLQPYRDCLKRYIKTKQSEAACVPLQWADIVPAKSP